jgi:hypothetical protein
MEPTPRPELTVGQVTPASGATLTFQACGTGCLRTEQIQTTFDVLVPVGIPQATVTVSLLQGSTPCAMLFIPTTLTAVTRTPFTTSSVSVTHDEGGQLLCAMPGETTLLRFAVYFTNSPARPVVAQELPYRYTLTTQ